MLKLILIFLVGFFAQAKLITFKNIIKNNNSTRIITTNFPEAKMDARFNQVNPFVMNSFSEISDVFTRDNKIVYSQTYHTGEYGIRVTAPASREVRGHLILAGDSNMFGIGVRDDETTPSQLAKKVSALNTYNFGMAGVGPNSTLFFLQNFSLEKVIGKNKKGFFIYDFHHHLIDRVIGSKFYLSWSKSSPRYEIESGQLVYKGTLESKWISKFYNFLNSLPYNEKLFPNLPRITHDHIELTAKVLAEMKKEYLRQTDANNVFIVAFNPAFDDDKFQEQRNDLQISLRKEGVETITFSKSELLSLPKIRGEIHMNAEAHAHYAEMLYNKLSSRF